MKHKLLILECALVASLLAQETVDHSGAFRTIPWRVSALEPGSCAYPEVYYNTVKLTLRECTTAGAWQNAVQIMGQPTIACVGTPGNTPLAFGQECIDATPAMWMCPVTAGCTTSGQLVAIGSGGGGASWIPCAGTPGATAGAAGSICVVPATGATYSCTATSPAACSVAVDWKLIPTQLSSVTNDAQTKAAVVPNTLPAAGQLLAGNAGGTAYAPVTLSGACTVTSAGVVSCPSAKNLYYAPGAKTINGTGASVMQCSSSCGVPTAIATGTTVTATLHAAIPTTLTSSSFWDQFVIPAGYANQQITIEVMWRTADNNAAHAGSVTFTSAQVAANGDISNPTLGNSTAITTTATTTASGLNIATGTFTPSWTAGNVGMWKAVAALGTLTSDLEIVSVRMYATF